MRIGLGRKPGPPNPARRTRPAEPAPPNPPRRPGAEDLAAVLSRRAAPSLAFGEDGLGSASTAHEGSLNRGLVTVIAAHVEAIAEIDGPCGRA